MFTSMILLELIIHTRSSSILCTRERTLARRRLGRAVRWGACVSLSLAPPLQPRFCLRSLRRLRGLFFRVRQQMEEQVAQKSSELEQYLQRVQELEDMYRRLEDALEDERQARQDEETVRKLQARLLEEEAAKRTELEQVHLLQQRAISQAEAEKQQLEKERLSKESALQAAMEQLEQLESERQGALEHYETVMKKLEDATNNTRTWRHKVAHHEGLIRLIQPGSKGHQMITNWGPAAFSEAELSLREKEWQERKNQPTQAQ